MNDGKPFDVKKVERRIEEAIATPLPAHAGLKSPAPSHAEYAPPAIRNANAALKSHTFEQIKAASKEAATKMANQYLSAAAAIEQTGREYKATQNALAAKLVDLSKIIEEDGEFVCEEYGKTADEYRERAHSLSADIELAIGKSDKAISLCHELLAILAATERMK